MVNFGDCFFRIIEAPTDAYYTTIKGKHCGHHLVKVLLDEGQRSMMPSDLYIKEEV
jgi:hypothetical protein